MKRDEAKRLEFMQLAGAIVWKSLGWLAKDGARVLDLQEIAPRLQSSLLLFTYTCAAAVVASKFLESFNR